MENNKMLIGAFLTSPGHHLAAWRHSEVPINSGMDINHYINMVKIAELGKLDFIFLSDGAGVRHYYNSADDLSRFGRVVHFEPLTLLSVLATYTKNIGLVATASTTYYEPFNLARILSSLDHISNGRLGWNVVTSATELEALNFNLATQINHEDRYKRANEFLEVILKLWDSWQEDAFIFNKKTGIVFNPTKLNMPNHKGSIFSIKGPLNLSRSPQRYPVIFQAGSSETGKAFASTYGEIIFTVQQNKINSQNFVKDLKNQFLINKTYQSAIKIMPGLFFMTAKTDMEAEDKYTALQDLVTEVEGLNLLTHELGSVIDLSKYDTNTILHDIPVTQGSKSKQALLMKISKENNMTIKQLYLSIAGGRGHLKCIGGYKKLCDLMEEWFSDRACDGFNIMPAILPTELKVFCDLVIPELQKRNLYKIDYTKGTLRDKFNLNIR